MDQTQPFTVLPPTTLLSPVPAVLVSCCGVEPDARPNLITVAWAGTVCSKPPMVSISLKPSRYSHHLIAESGEFVINLTDTAHCRALDRCGVKSGRDEDKFTVNGLTPVPVAGLDHAPAVAECPAWLACKVRQRWMPGSHEIFLAEVVSVGVQPRLIGEDGALRLDRADLVCYSHGLYHALGDALGFFGYSIARSDVLARRMSALASH